MKRLPPLHIVPAALLLASAAAAAAPPRLDYLFPSGGQRGQSVAVTAAGKFDAWPVETWVDRPGLSVEPARDKGKLTVKIAPDASPGVYWLRTLSREGASSLRPFVVGSLPELQELEPNNDPAKPQALDPGHVVNGRLEKAGDVDGFLVNLDGGQTLVASVMANRTLNSPMDGVLQVCSPDGFVLAQNDDFAGRDPQITFTAPHSGPFLVRLFAFPADPNSTIGFAGAATYVYRLTLTTGPMVDFTLPLAVSRDKPTPLSLRGWNLKDKTFAAPAAGDASFAVIAPPAAAEYRELPVVERTPLVAPADCGEKKPQPMQLGDNVSGVLESPRAAHVFTLKLTRGQPVFIRALAHTLNSALDPVLRATDAAGKVVAESDDIDAKTNRDSRVTFTPKADGEHRVELRDLHRTSGPRHFYLLTVEPAADFALWAADAATLAAGKSVEVTVNVERREKFASPIEIAALELPRGVTAAPVVSDNKTSAKSVKLKLTAAADAVSGPVRLVGKADGRTRPVTFTTPNHPTPHTAIWLHVTR